MFETDDNSKARRPRRVEVFTGPERRREWPDDRKIAIVAQSLEPGVNVSALARCHDINPQQLFGWRRQFRRYAEVLVASIRHDHEPISFAPVLPALIPGAQTHDSSIEIMIGKSTVRIRGAADTKTLALVLKALKVLA